MRGLDPAIWKCKDGREIPVAEMETDHLRNTVNMLIRKPAKMANAYQAYVFWSMLDELKARDEKQDAEELTAETDRIYNEVMADEYLWGKS